ncbi:zinc knuckle [Ancylostoma duodenale]|uniref:Zinc knuckle n=1 Tax=Ancylostoma duodenale TaxID=51022 RepID=A0A0C2H5D7_9BILA|nr:zinc knuckle [Ancylostoma duodenale]
MAAQTIDEEMEAKILMEADKGERIADLQKQVARLTLRLRDLTEKHAPCVRAMLLRVSEQLAKIKEVQNWFKKGVSKGAPTKISGKSEEVNYLKLETACNVIDQEISKLQQLSRQLGFLGELDLDQLAEWLDETLEQAGHDDSAMRTLSELLEVDSTQVVDSVKNTLLVGSKSTLLLEVPRADEEHPENESITAFQAQSDQPSTSGTQRASFSEKRDRFALCVDETGHARQNILPQRRTTPYWQRQQLANKPPKLADSLWKSPWSRCQGDSSLPRVESMVNNTVNAAFAAMALPDVPIYDNAQGKGFDQFLRSFLMKYGGLNLDDEVLIHLLCSKLGGQPHAVMETLPLNVRDGTFEEFTSALMAKFKENESARRMEAYIKLKKLRASSNITEYCVELEQLSRAAYPESTEKELSILRTGELISQLTEWPEYVQLFAVVEQTATEETYGKLKNVAQRVERSRQVALSLKQGYEDNPKWSLSHWKGPTSTMRTLLQSSGDHDRLQFDQEQEDHDQSDLAKAQKKYEPICHNCKKSGHHKRDCKELVESNSPFKQAEVHRDHDDNKRNPKENRARTFTTTLRQWSCSATHAKELPKGGCSRLYQIRQSTGGKKAAETVEATVPDKGKENVLWSLDKFVPHTICAKSKTELWQSSAVTNQGLFAATDPELAQPTLTEQDTDTGAVKVIHKRANFDKSNHVIERPLTLGDRVYTRTAAGKGSQRHTEVAKEWNGQFGLVELSKNSVLVAPISAKEELKRVPSNQPKMLPRGMDDEPVQATRSRAKRRKARKNKSVDTSCFRANREGADRSRAHPLHPLHPCSCGVSHERAHMALPDTESDLALSKKSRNLSKHASSRPIRNSVPMLDPVVNLGISLRQDGDRFHGWQILVLLEQLREAASNTRGLPKSKLKPGKKPENPAASQDSTDSQNTYEQRTDDEPERKKRKILRRPELLYRRDPRKKKKKEEQASHRRSVDVDHTESPGTDSLRGPACRCCA